MLLFTCWFWFFFYLLCFQLRDNGCVISYHHTLFLAGQLQLIVVNSCWKRFRFLLPVPQAFKLQAVAAALPLRYCCTSMIDYLSNLSNNPSENLAAYHIMLPMEKEKYTYTLYRVILNSHSYQLTSKVPIHLPACYYLSAPCHSTKHFLPSFAF